MANPIPTLSVVRYKGSGNVTVHKLLNGTTLDPTQDGSDVLIGTLETPAAGFTDNHANRLIEAFGKRFLLHGHRVYERDSGGVGNWGEVTSLAQSDTSVDHSGLHLLHPAGVPTLAFLAGSSISTGTDMAVFLTTDGTSWSIIDTNILSNNTTGQGMSVVYRDSIAWYDYDQTGFEISMYDFSLGIGNKLDLPGAANNSSGGGALHVHQNQLFAITEGPSNTGTLWRLDGTIFTLTAVLPVAGGAAAGQGYTMFSDGNDIITMMPDISTPPMVARVSDVLQAGSPSVINISSNYTSLLPGNGSYVAYVSKDPSPLTGDQGIYFWHRDGDFNTGSFDLFQFNFRRITHGSVTSGPFQINEVVTQSVTGAFGTVTNVGAGFLELTDVDETTPFDNTNTLTGGTSGATASSTSSLVEQSPTSLGSGISAVNFGLPHSKDGGLDRIPTATSVRPALDGLPVEITGSKTKLFFRVYGTGTPTISLELFASPNSEAPDTLVTLVGGTLIVESGAPATTPTISGNQITNITADSGVSLYSFQADLTAVGISSGQAYTLLLDIVV